MRRDGMIRIFGLEQTFRRASADESPGENYSGVILRLAKTDHP